VTILRQREKKIMFGTGVLNGLQDRTGFDRRGEIAIINFDDAVHAFEIKQNLSRAGNCPATAPGIAAMVNGARTGNLETLQLLGSMAQQMMQAGGDMARLAGILRPLVQGVRDAEELTAYGRNHVAWVKVRVR